MQVKEDRFGYLERYGSIPSSEGLGLRMCRTDLAYSLNRNCLSAHRVLDWRVRGERRSQMGSDRAGSSSIVHTAVVLVLLARGRFQRLYALVNDCK